MVTDLRGIDMILIPAGPFTMGSNEHEYEKPVHQVNLRAYRIGRTPVTVGQFRRYCSETGIPFSNFKVPSWGWREDHPMVNVNWEEARAFCVWAGGDLPTEAQWEKAARGPDGRRYPWANEWDAKKCQCSMQNWGDANSTGPVGSFLGGERLFATYPNFVRFPLPR